MAQRHRVKKLRYTCLLGALSILMACGPSAQDTVDIAQTSTMYPSIEAAFDAGDYPAAIRIGENRQLVEQLSSKDLEQLGLAYLFMGRCPSAFETWDRIVAIEPEDPAHHLAHFEALRRAGSESLGLSSMETAVALAPRDMAIRRQYAEALARANRVDEALDTIFSALEDDMVAEDRDRFAKTLRNIAYAHNRNDEIGGWLRRRVHERPGEVTAREDLLRVLNPSDMPEETISVAESLHNLEPHEWRHVERLIPLYVREGRWSDAEALLQPLIARGAEGRGAFGPTLAEVYVDLGKYAEADRLLDQLEAEFPGDSRVIEARGYQRIQHEQWDEVLELLASLDSSQASAAAATRALAIEKACTSDGVDSAMRFLHQSLRIPVASVSPHGESRGLAPHTPYPREDGRPAPVRFNLGNLDHLVDQPRLKALRRLAQSPVAIAATIHDLAGAAESDLALPAERTYVPDMARLYLAALLTASRDEEALAFLQRLWDLGYRDPDILDIELELLDIHERYASMRERYTALTHNPERAPLALRARLNVELIAAEYEHAEQTALGLLACDLPIAILMEAVVTMNRLGERERATRLAQQIAARAPMTPHALAGLFAMYQGLNVKKEADETADRMWQLFREWFEECPAGTEEKQFMLRIARLYSGCDAFESLRPKIKARLAEAESPLMLELLYEVSRESNEEDAALERLRAYARAHPEQPALRARVVRRLLSQARPFEAVDLAEQLLATTPQYLAFAGDWLDWLMRDETLLPRLEASVNAAAARVDSSQIVFDLARRWKQADRNETAANLYRRAIAVRPSFLDAHFELAQVLAEWGANAEAADIASQYLVQLRLPVESSDLRRLLRLFQGAQRIDELKAIFAAIAPEDAEIITTTIDASAVPFRDTTKAYALYEDLYAARPSRRYLSALIELSRRKGDWSAVLRWAEIERSLKPSRYSGLLAEAYLHDGQVDKGIALYKTLFRRPEFTSPNAEILREIIRVQHLDGATRFYNEIQPEFNRDPYQRIAVFAVILEAFRKHGWFRDEVAANLPDVDQESLNDILRPIPFDSEGSRADKQAFFESLLSMSPGNPAIMDAYKTYTDRIDPRRWQNRNESQRQGGPQ